MRSNIWIFDRIIELSVIRMSPTSEAIMQWFIGLYGFKSTDYFTYIESKHALLHVPYKGEIKLNTPW